MNRKKITQFTTTFTSLALALAVVGVAGCDDDEDVVATTDYTYDDAYLYDSYYPADIAYGGYAWADSWDYGGFYYLTAATPAGRPGITSALVALAKGQDICPGQVTVTQKTAAPACAGSSATELRNGVTIQFTGCQVEGGTIDGTLDVQSNRSASEQTCSPTTIITLGHTSLATNLSFTLSNGAKLVVPNQTSQGMTTYTFGQQPTSTNIQTNGELQIFNSAGTMLSDHTYMGDNTFTFSGKSSYSISGTTNVQEKNGNGTATITRTNLTRSGGCCRPTGGTVSVNRTGGLFPGQADWSFGPSCGQVSRNGTTAQMPACI
jgi:hypothetical protein